jgi:AbrB family looped-hinge helix DNA binding protein
MAVVARSKVSAQGRISVRAEIRQKLGIEPGCTLQWFEDAGQIVVRRAGIYSSEDIRKAIFGSKKPQARTDEEMDEGIRSYMRMRHPRG